MSSLKDALSHLTFRKAGKLLGAEGERLIREGGRYDVDVDAQATLYTDAFRFLMGNVHVTITLDGKSGHTLQIRCSKCSEPCIHQGAALSLLLEEKTALGLAAPPPERTPVENLSGEELIRQAIKEREERALSEKMEVVSANPRLLWTEYSVTSLGSGKTYRVSLRGIERGSSFCSCPDFRKNTLGTCKHILHLVEHLREQFKPATWKIPYEVSNIELHLCYGKEMELRLQVPKKMDRKVLEVLRPLIGRPITDLRDLFERIGKVGELGHEVNIFPDTEEYLNRKLYQEAIANKVAAIRKDPATHPLRASLLKSQLLPYQLDGIAFAVGAGRAILADDMGLGKTIQGIGVAELLAREAGIKRVLVVCPASLKSQWGIEIERFTDRPVQMVLGGSGSRAAQYAADSAFFTICNYEQVVRDIDSIEKARWDLIILDEGQRIKNWEAKTSRTIKGLRSRFALVLSGTPLENRLDELYSVVEFIDERRLGPAFQFFNTHRVVDEKGKVLGYKNLDELRERLKPVLLRRTRKDVMQDLPMRTTEIRRIPPSEEQLSLHNGSQKIVQTIITKPYISEMDLLRLQKALLLCRLAANSTFLVDKNPPGFSTKLQELDILLDQLTAEEDRKIILFSEWTRMLDLIEPFAEKRALQFVRLDGSVPQKKRQSLIHQFQNDPACKLFMTTNAGATGLNLQAANTIINVDLPWNPAILEQRIARAHRMGQKRPVQVYLLVTEETLEENLLATLSAKQELALAALDPNSDVTKIDLVSGIEELKRRLEVLLGAKPAAPIDESARADTEHEARELARKERIAAAGGQLLGAAFAFMGEIFGRQEETDQTREAAEALKQKLSECLEKDSDGRIKMTISLPDESVIDNLAKSLAQIMARA